MDKVRLDKWLWAARFFKTRNLAKQAIEGGKVHCDGQRVKPSKEIVLGAELTIRQGWDSKTVEVIALSDQRRGAPEAALLYKETQDSVAKRETEAQQRKLVRGAGVGPERRPTKKQRRQIHRFLDQDSSD
ncbi:ribosome-associated heat shock protein Hsp15 [Aestuariicella hydrocarbonica]|uniref:Heat shock protein 15 n=1 Tax=Pseudomaricurvus hydrocarbonicus TaxID=1470433 RepID=A0A9E5MNW9_9GAMM|nr:ribosome-associated heat shock protein Hsp15 [Aestuariicella hydrocarbonica]NHO67649.1 ribosome-associated heat shock protein Hsp15 [Aestuariicella hydrocarbonica]